MTEKPVVAAEGESSGGVTTLLEGWLERTAKYTKKWASRYVRFTSDLKVSYGETQDKVKHTMMLTRVVRLAEVQPEIKKDQLLVIVLEGTLQNEKEQKEDAWRIRLPNLETFEQWFSEMRDALARAGLMEARNCGLSADDPRSGLKFATIPLENLNRFGLLERAIVYFFAPVTIHIEGAPPASDNFLIVGDRHVYVFTSGADVVRCMSIADLACLYVSKELTGIRSNTEHDLLVETPRAAEAAQVLSQLYNCLTHGKELAKIPKDVPAAQLVKEMKTFPAQDWVLSVVSPTPKSRLKHALDAYERQHGTTFSAGAPSPPPSTAKAAHEPAQDAELDVSDPMTMLLLRLNLKQYIRMLRNKHIDLDMLSCMEEVDLESFGVDNPAHRKAIVAAAQHASGGPVPMSYAPSAPATSASAAAGAPTAQSAAAARHAAISLDSDEEEDILPIPQKKVAAAPPPQPKAQIDLDSDADELDVPQKKPASPSAAAPPSGVSTPARAVVSLDDDDI